MKELITPKFTMKKELYWQRVRGICILSVIGILNFAVVVTGSYLMAFVMNKILPQKMASSLGMS